LASDTKQKRKRKILDAAKKLVSEQGAGSLNMKELARIADVPRASLYRSYASKEHIISDITLEWGLSFASRLQTSSPRGRTKGERIKRVFKIILQEAEDNPLLIGAVLGNILSTDDSTRTMQIEFERLLPAALSSAVDCRSIPESKKVMDVLLRLLLANLEMLSSGRSSLKEALSHMVFAAEKLTGEKYWNE
jgi:AcrR family transcriptional regulator